MESHFFAALLAATALLGWFNRRFLRWPTNLALLALGLVVAVVLGLLERLSPVTISPSLTRLLRSFDFSGALLDVVLGLVLFAGGMSVDLTVFRRKWVSALVLATLGTAISVAVLSLGLSLFARWLEVDLPFTWAVVVAALISPTDPVAVLSMIGSRLDPERKAVLQGEALFNDGVGIVVFTAALGAASTGADLSLAAVTGSVLREFLIAVIVGGLGGVLLVWLMRSIDDYPVEIALTLGAATGLYAVANALGASGAIAASVAGLLAGTHHGREAMTETTSRYMHHFWDVIDQLLSALIFLLIGLETVALTFEGHALELAALTALLALIARAVAVIVPGLGMAAVRAGVDLRAIPILTWGGVRGAVTVALALSVTGEHRQVVLLCAYASVLVSVLVQGPTLRFVVRATT